jgi:hypothetical protein
MKEAIKPIYRGQILKTLADGEEMNFIVVLTALAASGFGCNKSQLWLLLDSLIAKKYITTRTLKPAGLDAEVHLLRINREGLKLLDGTVEDSDVEVPRP